MIDFVSYNVGEGWCGMMEDFQWKAILECDKSYDRTFFYGVSTTKIFCRPSCKSREPKKEHVQIFPPSLEAINQGFRPCKRCRPEELQWQGNDDDIVQQVKLVIQTHFQESLTLTTISEMVSLSPYHVHRVFKRKEGFTIGEFLLDRRIAEAKKLLEESSMNITDVSLITGFSSISHFSFMFRKHNGCNPSEYRRLFLNSGAQELGEV